MPLLALEKILHAQGFGCRRTCRQLISTGQVRVQGEWCTEPMQRHQSEGLSVQVGGVDWVTQARVHLALHKPAGFECSRAPTHHPSVLALLPLHLRNRGVQPVGRLDQDTTGLLLLTDDGPWLQRLTHPRRHVPRRYEVVTAAALTAEQIQHLQAGVALHHEDGLFVAHRVQQLGERQLAFDIHQGVYHQVKRMMAAVGNPVVALHRSQIGQLVLADLPLGVGEWMLLDAEQVAQAQSP